MDILKINKFAHIFSFSAAGLPPGGADGNLITNYADDGGPSEEDIMEWLRTTTEDETPEEEEERLEWMRKRTRSSERPEQVDQIVTEIAESMGISPESRSMYVGEGDDEWRVSVEAGHDPESGPGFGALVMRKPDGQWFMRPPYADEDKPIDFEEALEIAGNFGQSKELHRYHGLI
jgi:hypothetical protein